jgi:hypothetical protein
MQETRSSPAKLTQGVLQESAVMRSNVNDQAEAYISRRVWGVHLHMALASAANH